MSLKFNKSQIERFSRQIILKDIGVVGQKKILESFLHPVIRENITNQILSSESHYTIIMVPLIFETNSMNQYQRILVIDCDEELQISRATKRDNSSKEDIQKIIDELQLVANTEKLKAASDSI